MNTFFFTKMIYIRPIVEKYSNQNNILLFIEKAYNETCKNLEKQQTIQNIEYKPTKSICTIRIFLLRILMALRSESYKEGGQEPPLDKSRIQESPIGGAKDDLRVTIGFKSYQQEKQMPHLLVILGGRSCPIFRRHLDPRAFKYWCRHKSCIEEPSFNINYKHTI